LYDGYPFISGGKAAGFLWENVRERDHWGNPGLDGRIILRRIYRKWDVRVRTRLSWLTIETGGEHL
jgi:hypothetical protein